MFGPTDGVAICTGDFSFAHSLWKNHRFHGLCATTFETRDTLLAKHPQTAAFISDLESGERPTVAEAEDKDERNTEAGSDEEDHDFSEDSDGQTAHSKLHRQKYKGEIKVLYEVDAAKLERQKYFKNKKWDRVIFNFPHVGGKSTDVNRQVRYNQELLVAFFKSAMPLLSAGGAGRDATTGSIVVTLFEGSPYTLWNIRDLARHSGLAVETSFVFQASAYPGYRHARTLGNLKSKDEIKGTARNGSSAELDKGDHDAEADEQDAGNTPADSAAGAWRGENRPARTYIFKLKDEATAKGKTSAQPKKNKKRKGAPDDSDSEDHTHPGDGVKTGRVPLPSQDELRPEPKGFPFKKHKPAPR